MSALTDTIVWIANVPATYGYAMVFLAAFGAFGLFAASFRGGGGARKGRLIELRRERGQSTPGMLRRRIARVRNWAFRIAALGLIGGGVIGILSLTNGPITSGYIAEHGETAIGTVPEGLSGDWVRFTASDGRTYTLPFSFFTQPSYPGDESPAFAGDELVIHYLPDHPQAYVLDTERTLDSWGEPIGD
ncbi:MAG: hypothetical protein ACTHZX_09550 [Microbacterium sp.]